MIKTYSVPSPEFESEDFSAALDGIKAVCYKCRVSAIPFNRVWPGSQRPLWQTEEASFLYFSSDSPVEIKLTASRSFKDVTVRPLSKGIKPVCSGREMTFVLPGAGQYTVETDGMHHALHIFVNPIRDFGVREGDDGVIYFGAGVHDAGHIELHTGQTLYIAGGAVVHGSISAKDSSNIRIIGEGVLDNSIQARGEGGCLKLFGCRNVEISGIIFNDSAEWTATMFNCDNILFDNVKAIGMWRYNSDGFDFVNSANCTVRGCFLRSFDDVIVLKGLKGYDSRPVENIHVSDCVLWCDWGRNFEIGAETCADEYRNILFEDCDLIHCAHINLDIQNDDRADVHDVIFDNIRVEYSRYNQMPVYQDSDDMKYNGSEGYMPQLITALVDHGGYSQDTEYGSNSRVTFRNIAVTADQGLPMPPSTLVGKNADHMTSDIIVENVTFNGVRVSDASALRLYANEFTENITVK